MQPIQLSFNQISGYYRLIIPKKFILKELTGFSIYLGLFHLSYINPTFIK